MNTFYKNFTRAFAMLFLLTIQLGFAQAAKLHSLFDQYQNTDGVTSIKIAKPMFRMLGSMNINDSDLNNISPILNKVDGLKILIVEGNGKKNNPANSQTVLKNEILSAVKNLNYEELMSVKSKDNNVKFLAEKTSGDIFNNLLLTIAGDDSDVLMILDGKISMNDINNLVEETQNMVDADSASPFSENRNVSTFHGIDISSGISATIEQSASQKVTVETDAGKQQFVKTTVENGILKVYVEKSNGARNFKKLNVKIAAPTFNSIKVSGGARMTTSSAINNSNLLLGVTSGSNVKGTFNIQNDLNIIENTGANIDVRINTKTLNLDSSTGSNAKLEGSAELATVNISSGSSLNAINFAAKNLTVNAGSASNAKVFSTETLFVKASSAASVNYRGEPKTKTLVPSSGASINQIKN